MTMLKHLLYESYHTPRRFLYNLLDEPAIVLLYHRVCEMVPDHQQLCISPANFRQQVEHLKESYNILTAEEFHSILAKKRQFPPRSVLLTFDDGYADNFLNALPILQSLNAQAIFYITTGLLDTTTEFWWDSLERVFFESQSLPPEIRLRLNDSLVNLPTNSSGRRMRAYRELHHHLKYSLPTQRAEIIHTLLRSASLPLEGRPANRVMSSAEVQRMAQFPSAVVGAHTHTHTPLRILSYEQRRDDILQSKTILENLTGQSVRNFSYPYGLKKDYDTESIRLCNELGFSMVSSNFYDQVHTWTDPFQLPRIIVRNWPLNVFQRKMRKFFRA